jgi:hypothetical protein
MCPHLGAGWAKTRRQRGSRRREVFHNTTSQESALFGVVLLEASCGLTWSVTCPALLSHGCQLMNCRQGTKSKTLARGNSRQLHQHLTQNLAEIPVSSLSETLVNPLTGSFAENDVAVTYFFMKKKWTKSRLPVYEKKLVGWSSRAPVSGFRWMRSSRRSHQGEWNCIHFLM